MGVQVGDGGVGQQPTRRPLQRRPVHEVGVDHHACGVERAQRQRAGAQERWNLAGGRRGLRGALPDVDGVARAERAVRRLVCVVNEDHRLARLGVGEADAAGKAGLGVGGAPHGAPGGELGVGQGEQGRERRGRQGLDLEHRNLRESRLDLRPPPPAARSASCAAIA